MRATSSPNTDRVLQISAIGRLALVIGLLGTTPAGAQVYLPDDPIWSDPDRLDVPAPEPREISDVYDFWANTFGSPADYRGPALNVNTLGEVPNSSWYSNRHYWHRMSPEKIGRGPNTTGGPSTSGPWDVVAAKTEGKTPGMEIIDARGDRYLLKFDPTGYIELTSGAEVIATKLLYALGYNVPENYPVRFNREQLRPGAGDDGEGSPVTELQIDEILSHVARYPDGSYRALASLLLSGEPIGPFLYYGTRRDDANDIWPHEARRELRGLKVISAWINHTDSRSMNTLDVLVEHGDSSFVKHYLIDFGSTVGASPLGPKNRWQGFEHILDGRRILLRTVTLGIAGLDWAGIDYPEIPAVGHLALNEFEPTEWRPEYPNPAFRQADADDAFWAAKQIASLSDEAIRAAVESAAYSDPRAVEYITRALALRRDVIARAYLGHGGGLDRFTVEGDTLQFVDLRHEARLTHAESRRSVTWRTFDNRTGGVGEPIATFESSEPRLSIPSKTASFLVAEIATEGSGVTRVYLRRGDGGYEVVGIERE